MSKLAKALSGSAGNAGSDPVYVEDVFSTFLYEGNGATQTITNGIDLSGEGGMTWLKDRGVAQNHHLYDTERGVQKAIFSNLTFDEITFSNALSSFNSTGFSIEDNNQINVSTNDYASWSFRKQKGFFDCVKFSTTSGGGQQTVSHNLGSIPGTIILKQLTAGGDGYWYVFHKSVTSPNSDWWRNYANLNITAAFGDWGSTAGIYSAPTSSGITVSTYFTNQTADFIAYFFAEGGSDDQIFGDDGDENIIKCGTFATAGSGGRISSPVNCGFEAQWVLVKNVALENWNMYDIMRGMDNTGYTSLYPNLNDEEYRGSSALSATATGFDTPNSSGPFTNSATYIYIAIRRGPMKTPEAGTEVFASQNPGYPLNSAGEAFTSGFPVDWALSKEVSATDDWLAMSRMQGEGNFLETNTTAAEASGITYGTFDHMTGWYSTASANMSWMFRRAPGFFDVVARTGTGGSGVSVPHNLTVVPELVISKTRTASGFGTDLDKWFVWSSAVSGSGNNTVVQLQSNSYNLGMGFFYPNSPTASAMTVHGNINYSGDKLVYYLFATLAGVSKVGNYTGTGSSLNVPCGFTAGARFILIKRTDATGDWYIYDSTRGISASGTNDPYLFINTTAAQVTNTDYIGILNAGFTVTSSAPAALNASGGTYIFLAIA